MKYASSRVSRVVGDSGAVLTIETTRNSELIDTIFKKFALKMVELSCIKGLANNCQNKTSLWTDFKNSFTWLTGMKKLIFGINNFFGSGHFSIYRFWKKWSKNDRSKKIFCTQKSALSYISNAQKKFWNRCLFSNFWAKTLIELSSTNFKAKILKMASFNSEFLIVSVVNTAPESPTTLLTLPDTQ